MVGWVPWPLVWETPVSCPSDPKGDGPGLPVVVTVLPRARCSAAAAVSPSATGLALQGSQVGLTYGHPSSSLPGHDPSSPSAG
ncbi:unnamed protein product [Rangifer tarandus platyrhynchus]|uniref:Uncharacterized protein n=1 Tax=Rangifer tarandus platyrhynchus TaxID=3082113 RepID=A0AC59YC53_RANTA